MLSYNKKQIIWECKHYLLRVLTYKKNIDKKFKFRLISNRMSYSIK